MKYNIEIIIFKVLRFKIRNNLVMEIISSITWEKV